MAGHKNGFTLIELSIVLVIIGLIAGGILVGRELINQAAIKSQVTQIEQYKTAMNAFRIKYNCRAGDCANATQFFGDAGGACSSNGTITSPQTATCNGNGNGQVVYDNSIPTGSQTLTREVGLFWQHLANAGLIDGQYTGDIGYGGASEPLGSTGGLNIPRGKYGDSVIMYLCGAINYNCSENNTDGNGVSASSFYIGGNSQEVGGFPVAPVMTVVDAKAFDEKIDDGYPHKGVLRVTGSISNQCIQILTQDVWEISNTRVACRFQYLQKP